MTAVSRVYPKDEITANPIFLLELRRVIAQGADLRWDSDREMLMHGEREATDEYLVEHEMGVEVWEVYGGAGVWFTRAEAEAWADAHSYRVGGRQNFRVYCVCARGELATLLASVTTREAVPR